MDRSPAIGARQNTVREVSETVVPLSDSINVRSASPEDVSALQEFLRPFVVGEFILPRSDEDLLTLIQHGFVAEFDGEILGFAAIEIYSKKLAEVQSLAVAQAVQGRGVGSRLVEHCVDRAKALGVLEVMAITASEDLFRKVGFDYSLPNQKRALFVQVP